MMNATCTNPPVIFIMPEAKNFLDLYIKLCPEEISGLGEVRKIGDSFLIERVHLLEQVVSAASTDLDQGDVSNFMVDAIRRGIDTEKIKLWWHSHVNGSCFWSSVDDATMDRFQNGWMLAIVGNKHGEYKARLDLYEPLRLTIDEVPIQIYNEMDRALVAPVKAEIKKKVTIRPYRAMGYAGRVGFAAASGVEIPFTGRGV